MLLNSFKDGSISPNAEDPFPATFLAMDLNDCSGPLIQPARPVPLEGVAGKTLYRLMVKTLNKKKLNGRRDTPWRSYFAGAQETGPQWRSLYKPPLSKRHGDLQWRLLHGIIAVNAFLSIIKNSVEDKCPFCNVKETLFHCFYECHRLSELFLFLQVVFTSFKEFFNKQGFIYGFKYTREQKHKSQLLNFVLGQAKMAVYITRKRMVEQDAHIEPVPVCINMIKSRILVDFSFYKAAGDLDSFNDLWCFQDVLCSVTDRELLCADYLV